VTACTLIFGRLYGARGIVVSCCLGSFPDWRGRRSCFKSTEDSGIRLRNAPEASSRTKREGFWYDRCFIRRSRLILPVRVCRQYQCRPILSFPNMATEEPLLTIAIPTFNSAHLLPDAIASIMRQGLDDFEILIIDNASEDNTEEVVRLFKNHAFGYLRNPSNLGACENGNRCFSEFRGRYFKLLCADDVLLDRVLLKQLIFSRRARCRFGHLRLLAHRS